MNNRIPTPARSETPADSSAGRGSEAVLPALADTRRRFSPEIHGIRGLALTLVVAFHLFGQGRVSGGVDVFLVVSAFLVTGSLDRAFTRDSTRSSRTFSLASRYARTFSRLVPASLLTVVATVVAALVVLPRSRAADIFEQASASALFHENIFLATSGRTYEAAGNGTSPFQHFWSLSVQGQFLLLWPAVALVLFLCLRAIGRRWSTPMFIAITALMTVASFGYAVWLVSVNQPVAYYSLPARLWEFGLGALAALIVPRLASFQRVGAVLGWGGVALILSSGFVLNGRDLFPGPWTLWPVLGAIFVLFAADSGGARRSGLTQTLSLGPIAWLAGLGYTLYLWHWPVLVLYLEWRGYDHVGWKGALAVLMVSLALAEATNRLVVASFARWSTKTMERPRGAWRVLLMLALCLGVVGGGAWFGHRYEIQRAERELAAGREANAEHPGARALLDPDTYPQSWDSDPIPAPDVARTDFASIGEVGCIPGGDDTDFRICRDRPGEDAVSVPEAQRKRVVLAGGSHDSQYYDALREIADSQGWELLVVSRDGCRLTTDDSTFEPGSNCFTWSERAPEEIIALHPDAVISLATVTNPGKQERVTEGQIGAWRLLDEAGILVIGLRDNPRFSDKIPECVETSEDPAVCGVARADIYAEEFPAEAMGLPKNLIPIDTSPMFCPDDWCPAYIGNVLVYRDHSHFTRTYGQTLVPFLLEQFQEKAPFLFE